MQPNPSKCAALISSAAALAVSFALPAAAHTHHWRAFHRHHYSAYERPLTVTKRHPAAIVAAPDPYRGPAAVVTAPNAVAATVVSLPFRAANVVFPPYGSPGANPLVLIGAPVHAAEYVAEFPFFVIGSAFGAPPRVIY